MVSSGEIHELVGPASKATKRDNPAIRAFHPRLQRHTARPSTARPKINPTVAGSGIAVPVNVPICPRYVAMSLMMVKSTPLVPIRDHGEPE